MTVTAVARNLDAATMTITAEFDAPVEKVWQLWEDPRLLERWWGPPVYPATVVDHDLAPGGMVRYFMTGPEGDRHHGWWRIAAVTAPRRLEFEDGFADEAGNPNPELPTTVIVVSISARADGGSRMEINSRFASREAMEQLVAMGMVEGMSAAMGQMDGLLAA